MKKQKGSALLAVIILFALTSLAFTNLYRHGIYDIELNKARKSAFVAKQISKYNLQSETNVETKTLKLAGAKTIEIRTAKASYQLSTFSTDLLISKSTNNLKLLDWNSVEQHVAQNITSCNPTCTFNNLTISNPSMFIGNLKIKNNLEIASKEALLIVLGSLDIRNSIYLSAKADNINIIAADNILINSLAAAGNSNILLHSRTGTISIESLGQSVFECSKGAKLRIEAAKGFKLPETTVDQTSSYGCKHSDYFDIWHYTKVLS